MGKLCFLLALGLMPLEAQVSINNSAQVIPPKPPDPELVVPSPEATSAAISTNIAMPAAPLVQVKLDRFAVSPGTVREGLIYQEAAKTIVTLSGPATKTLVCNIVSSDPGKVACEGVTFQPGEQEKEGVMAIKWKEIEHDSQVAIKVYDAAHPETVLHSRLYLRIDPVERSRVETQ